MVVQPEDAKAVARKYTRPSEAHARAHVKTIVDQLPRISGYVEQGRVIEARAARQTYCAHHAAQITERCRAKPDERLGLAPQGQKCRR